MCLCLKASLYYQWIWRVLIQKQLRANHILNLSILVLGVSKDLCEIIISFSERGAGQLRGLCPSQGCRYLCKPDRKVCVTYFVLLGSTAVRRHETREAKMGSELLLQEAWLIA